MREVRCFQALRAAWQIEILRSVAAAFDPITRDRQALVEVIAAYIELHGG